MCILKSTTRTTRTTRTGRETGNVSRVVHLVNCILLGSLRVYTEFHDPFDSYGS